ncbi:carotenoid oxygenase [Xylogone sp. PMI_703]|nr:carotenoid oxygenase [Xylogone sp. PMI_703]
MALYKPETTVLTRFGLKSKWPLPPDLGGSAIPLRLEGEIADLIIDGTFYRLSPDPFFPNDTNLPIDGDGSISAFRIHQGHVDFKIKYVQTERFKLERRANKALFGLYSNPWSHHPCVRAAIDSTGTTNVIYWANRLLTLEENACPYELDPDSLETLGYNPFGDQVENAKAFTAHPKVDPFTEELVVFGYEALGVGTDDIVIYALDKNGKKTSEMWLKAAGCTMAHDCAITENWLVILFWPFEASVEWMKAGGNHWSFSYDKPSCFLVVPRRPKGEHRVYNWNNCMNLHTAGAWEKDEKIYLEATRAHGNIFPYWGPDDGIVPSTPVTSDFPSGSRLPDPKVVFDIPYEFPRIDEPFLSKEYRIIFMKVLLPSGSESKPDMYQGLNGLVMVNTQTGDKQYYNPGPDSSIQEPAFIPRSDDAKEGDGWVIAMVEDRTTNLCHLVILDTKDFGNPVAVAQLPFRVRDQIHGNWVDAKSRGGGEKSLVAVPGA